MRSVEAELFISTASGSAPPLIGFAEPDWCGDADYQARLTGGDKLDDRVHALAEVIRLGRLSGRLDAYYSRRAAFDLQSIRGQIERQGHAFDRGLADRGAAILSRLDRLSACLDTVMRRHEGPPEPVSAP